MRLFERCLLLGAAALALSCEGSAEHSIAVVETRPSPGGDYKAVVYTDMGGGAAGWCDTYVEILPTSAELAQGTMRLRGEALMDRYRRIVFRHGECGAKLDLTWLANDHLEIAYDVEGLVSTDQKDKSEVANVNVSFVVRTPQMRRHASARARACPASSRRMRSQAVNFCGSWSTSSRT